MSTSNSLPPEAASLDVPSSAPECPAADRDQIAGFVDAMFKHADQGTFASLRSFTHNAGDPPLRSPASRSTARDWRRWSRSLSARPTGRPGTRARRCSRRPWRRSPTDQAREVDLANGLGCRSRSTPTRRPASRPWRGSLGAPRWWWPAAATWTDPATGEVQPKLHGHWRTIGADPHRRGARQAEACPPPRYGPCRRRRDQRPGGASDPLARLGPPEGRAEARQYRRAQRCRRDPPRRGAGGA